ncbi:MAG: DUF348 domain-containing protein [Chloroflexi bacterium]|nr:DUF348 domain-containing protein [Chloroflexota bacterium]
MTAKEKVLSPQFDSGSLHWGRRLRDVAGWRPATGLQVFVGIILTAWLLIFGYRRTMHPVSLLIDGQPVTLQTHQTTIEGMLAELAGPLYPEDIVLPARSGPLPTNRPIQIQLASLVQVKRNGRTTLHRTHLRKTGELLRELGVQLGVHDRVLVDGQVANLDTPLPQPAVALSRRIPFQLTILRALPLYVDDDGVPMQFETLAPTIGEALWQQDVVLYLGDQVFPPLGTPTSSGIRVHIRRSRPITLMVDGREIHTRSRAKTVELALQSAGISLNPLDRVTPKGFVQLQDNLTIRVVRVAEKIVTEQEPIPFETKWRPNAEMEIDARNVDQKGVPGVRKRQVRITYEDGKEVRRGMEKEWIDRDPVDEIIAYGTKIVLRDLETPEGTFQYWRKVRLLATSYTAATSGKARNHPLYGITRLGLRAGKGIVAVDPTVVKLGTYVYVPGYGKALVGDTGGRILGKRIDLGFDEDNLQLWYRWVDVYLMAPAPPASQIRYILPSWPRERRR